jgi:hypothetical protein
MKPIKITIKGPRIPIRTTSSMTLRSTTPSQSTRTTPPSAQHGAHEPTFATTPRQLNAKRKNVDRDSGKSKKVQRGDTTNVSKRPIDSGYRIG